MGRLIFSIIFMMMLIVESCSKYPKNLQEYTEEVGQNLRDCNNTCIVKLSNSTYFKYNNGTVSTMDKEKYHPLSFEIYLPPRMKFFQVHSTKRFEFYYSNKEVIIIETPYVEEDKLQEMQPYKPSLEELNKFLGEGYNAHNKYDLSEIEMMPNRINRVKINNSGVVFCLYNIKNDNIDDYLSMLSSFNLLP